MQVQDRIAANTPWVDLSFLQPILEVHGAAYSLQSLEDVKRLLVSEFAVSDSAVLSREEFSEAALLAGIGYRSVEEHLPQIEKLNARFQILSRDKPSNLLGSWSSISAFACQTSVYCFLFPEGNWRDVLTLNAIHELHHVVRYQYSRPHESFLDWLLLVGLAGLFEEELFPSRHSLPGWTATPEATLLELLPMVMEFWNSTEFMRNQRLANDWLVTVSVFTWQKRPAWGDIATPLGVTSLLLRVAIWCAHNT